MRLLAVVASTALGLLLGCGPQAPAEVPEAPAAGDPEGAAVAHEIAPPAEGAEPPAAEAARCSGAPLTIHFFDVAQGLAALVQLPDGRNLLVDAGDMPNRPGCGAPCKDAHQHLLAELRAAVPSLKLDAVWITHQHSDHHGGLPGVLAVFKAALYVDNGTDLAKNGVVKARKAATDVGAQVVAVEPGNVTSPIANSAEITFTPILPPEWPGNCSDPNNCSIGLRIDYCSSSILFTGDAEAELETIVEPGDVNLLQVGHHGRAAETLSSSLICPVSLLRKNEASSKPAPTRERPRTLEPPFDAANTSNATRWPSGRAITNRSEDSDSIRRAIDGVAFATPSANRSD